MSRYRVQYLQQAADDLALVWHDAQDRGVVTRASYEAEQELSSDPLRFAEHLSEGLYRLEVPPLRLYFTVRDEDHTIEVCNIKSAT